MQFRGGPAGFLKVLDDKMPGHADSRGNVPFISADNLTHEDRVSIILMDCAHRARPKILGRARLVAWDEDPALMAQLEAPGSRARVERGVVIEVEAYDWNCPQHITPRMLKRVVDLDLDLEPPQAIATILARLGLAA